MHLNLILRLSLFFLFCPFLVKAQQTKAIAGTWGGILNPGTPLKIIFHIRQDSAGQLSATADSPDQHAFGMAVENVTLSADSIIFDMPDIHARYAGLADWTKMQITGSWHQKNYAFPLVLDKLESDTAQPVLQRPQEPRPPFPYMVKEVTFTNADQSITYGATLTYPSSPGRFPAVVLITGSGQHDRNESLMGHKPFLVLADYLTRRGIAVLRADDRGIGQSTDPKATFSDNTSADFMQDVISQLSYLRSQPMIDTQKIGLIGHSEGGLIASMTAARDKSGVAFIVLMAGPGEKIADLMTTQIVSTVERLQYSQPAIVAYRQLTQHAIAIVNSHPDDDSAKLALQSYFEEWKQQQPDSVLAKLQAQYASGADFARQEQPFLTPWFRYFLQTDPGQYLVKVKCPVLALNGEMDVQVSAKENLPAIRAALEKGGNKNYKIVELPGLNHLMQTARTGEVNEYGTLSETISPGVLQLIGDWILQQVK